MNVVPPGTAFTVGAPGTAGLPPRKSPKEKEKGHPWREQQPLTSAPPPAFEPASNLTSFVTSAIAGEGRGDGENQQQKIREKIDEGNFQRVGETISAENPLLLRPYFEVGESSSEIVPYGYVHPPGGKGFEPALVPRVGLGARFTLPTPTTGLRSYALGTGDKILPRLNPFPVPLVSPEGWRPAHGSSGFSSTGVDESVTRRILPPQNPLDSPRRSQIC